MSKVFLSYKHSEQDEQLSEAYGAAEQVYEALTKRKRIDSRFFFRGE